MMLKLKKDFRPAYGEIIQKTVILGGMDMNIVLLSGGGGKRLWPLSNDVRSKQFIQLFKNENGEYESMLQRVYRQVIMSDNNAKIIVASSKTQVSSVKNQLGTNVLLCVEPCRKDTFPAIVLAVACLHDEFCVNEDEIVIVCPVDPYVENSYYEAVKDLEEIAANSEINLTLMGVEPVYPSEKYGYIIPENEDMVSRVLEFKEKPDTVTAKKYIERHALWNTGVFAFKTGYLLEKAKSIIGFNNYNDLLNKYSILDQVSFDYAISEKEDSIQVLRYNGFWKDVGTWDAVSEVMEDKIKGRVMIDSNCMNTNVVNELDIPLLCIGCNNMVVAASRDGILVSAKEHSSCIKPYVDMIGTEPMFAEKSWGNYSVIDMRPGFMAVRISMKMGGSMSYHMHSCREEVWTVVSGKGKAVVDGIEQFIQTGDVVTIMAGCKHMVEAITPLNIIEVQIGEIISKCDKTKYFLEQ